MFYDELKAYLEKNLKIYLKPDNKKIDYLALTDSNKIVNKAVRKQRS